MNETKSLPPRREEVASVDETPVALGVRHGSFVHGDDGREVFAPRRPKAAG